MTEPLASRSPSTGAMCVPPRSHVAGAPLEWAEPVASPTEATVLASTIVRRTLPGAIVGAPLTVLQVREKSGSHFVVACPDIAPDHVPAIGSVVPLVRRSWSLADGRTVESLVAVQ